MISVKIMDGSDETREDGSGKNETGQFRDGQDDILSANSIRLAERNTL